MIVGRAVNEQVTPSLAEGQRAFGYALLDPACPIPRGIVDLDGKPSVRRFNVYRNNVVAGLASTLKDAYPVVTRLVGEEFFTAMATCYVRGSPPDSPMMFTYGAGFADFIASFAPAAGLPYLPDVARIERAWVEAYHARECEPLDPTGLSAVCSEDCLRVCLTLHPSFRLVRSQYPAGTIWAMNARGGALLQVDVESGGEDVLIVRPQSEVEMRTIVPGCAELLAELARGCSLMEAARAALRTVSEFDLEQNLLELVESGVFVEWRVGSPESLPRPTGQL